MSAIAETPTSLQKIRISDDHRRFVPAGSNKSFVPWGFNYLGEFGKLVEDSWDADWPRLERDFREMRKLGANVVRVHLQFGTYMKGPDEFDRTQLDRLRRMLDLGRECGLYLDLTGLCCYRLADIPAWYDKLDETDRWEIQARWWKEIARTCSGHPAVFCYDLMNEPVVGGPAKPGEPRWVGGELGGFYFVQRLSEDARGRTNVQIAAAWSSKMTEAIRQEDPQTLITVGVIPWAQIWPNAKPVFYSPEAGKHFDFVSIHVYPGKGEVDRALAALMVYEVGKPLVVEETFPLNCTLDEMNQFVEGGRDRVDGWVSHYFGSTIDEHRRGAGPKGSTPDAVADFLEYWRDKGKEIVGVDR
ncbi:cellulase family glycosylhydrolase [Caulifigura coniformis]|nr:cellulase family glycosylhydrolase [Caulifigura coniformis]